MRYQLNRLQQFAKLESRGVCGSKPGSHGALQHVSPLTTTTIPVRFHPATPFQCNKIHGFIYISQNPHPITHLPCSPYSDLYDTTTPLPPSPSHVPIPVLIAHVSPPSAPWRTAEGSHTKTSKQDTRAAGQSKGPSEPSSLLGRHVNKRPKGGSGEGDLHTKKPIRAL